MASFYCPVCEKDLETPVLKECGRTFCSGLERYTKYFTSNVGIKTYSISLAGGSSSGKTYYLINLIGRLTNQIEDIKLNQYLNSIGLEFNFASKKSKDYFKELKTILDRNKGYFATIPQAEGAEPFEIELIKNGRERFLLNIYNTAGEYYRTDNIDHKKWLNKGQFKDSNTYLYFIDPIEDSGFNHLLNRENKKNYKDGPPKDFDVLDVVQELMLKKENGAKIQAPFAVVLSKFDLLEHLNGQYFQQPYVELEDIYRDGQSGNYGLQAKLKEVESFIEQFSTMSKPSKIKKHFFNTQYFGVSNMGHNSNFVLSDMNPKGIYAPFFWILSQINIL